MGTKVQKALFRFFVCIEHRVSDIPIFASGTPFALQRFYNKKSAGCWYTVIQFTTRQATPSPYQGASQISEKTDKTCRDLFCALAWKWRGWITRIKWTKSTL